MQRVEKITVAGRSVAVSEIPVNRILAMFQGEKALINLPLPDAMEEIKGLLPLTMDIPIEELLQQDLFYDDCMKIVDAVKKTNPAFFELAAAFGLGDELVKIVRGLLQAYANRLLFSLNEDTEMPSGDGDTASSLK